MEVESEKITLNNAIISKIILEYVVKKYGKALGVYNASELDWNWYSLMTGEDGLWFTKKVDKIIK